MGAVKEFNRVKLFGPGADRLKKFCMPNGVSSLQEPFDDYDLFHGVNLRIT
jgi:hypothetical protein